MGLTYFGLILSLGIILFGCELFTNGIEVLGKRLKLGDGVVGSIFSAVGTCLPETLIPVIAILFSKTEASSMDVGVGAILGAPFMLSTLAFFVTGFSVLIFSGRRKTGLLLQVNPVILSHDIKFFILVYSTSIIAAFINSVQVKSCIALGLIALYIFYIIVTVNSDYVSDHAEERLIIGKYLRVKPGLGWILTEVALALGAIIFGAGIFVDNIQIISGNLGIPALVLSLIITPIATELPEKFNSIIWISKKKDTLALGNITGAMVFQSCIPVAIGILATPWKLDTIGAVSCLISIISALLVYLELSFKKKLSAITLMMGAVFYSVFILFLLFLK